MRCIIISPIRCRYHMDTTFLEYNKDTQLWGYVLVSGYVRILSYSTHCSYPPEGAGRSREWGFSLHRILVFYPCIVFVLYEYVLRSHRIVGYQYTYRIHKIYNFSGIQLGYAFENTVRYLRTWVWASFSYMCAVTVGTDVYSCEVRIHLLTPLGVGNNIHSYIRTKSIFICICALYMRQPYRKSKKAWLSPGTTLTTSHACELSIARWNRLKENFQKSIGLIGQRFHRQRLLVCISKARG
jgi:hypothetical protein